MIAEKLKPAIEAVLFASGDPVPASRMCEVLETDEITLHRLLKELQGEYTARSSGIEIIRMEDSWQMVSGKGYAAEVRQSLDIKRNTPLSPAALEVLAVVVYNQPVTKSFVEQVRGVDCSGVVSSLCEKGLLTEAGRLDLPGRPLLYTTTPDFLRCFNMQDLTELPALPEDMDSSADEPMADMPDKNQLTLDDSEQATSEATV